MKIGNAILGKKLTELGLGNKGPSSGGFGGMLGGLKKSWKTKF